MHITTLFRTKKYPIGYCRVIFKESLKRFFNYIMLILTLNVLGVLIKEAMVVVNEAIVGEDYHHFMRALSNPILQMPALDRHVGDFYHQEFKIIHHAKDGNLSQFDVLGGVKVLNAVIAINDSIDKRSEPLLQQCLSDDTTGLDDVRYENVAAYMKKLSEMKENKFNNGLLTLAEISECVEAVNKNSNKQFDRLYLIDEINRLIESRQEDNGQLIGLLENSTLDLQNVYSFDVDHYFHMLKKAKEEKLKHNKNDGLLRWEDIQDIVTKTNLEKAEATDKHMDYITLNKAVENKMPSDELIYLLKGYGKVENVEVKENKLTDYRMVIEDRQKAKRLDDKLSGFWYPVESESKMKFYINVKNGEVCDKLREEDELSYYLTPSEITDVIRAANDENADTFEKGVKRVPTDDEIQMLMTTYYILHENQIITVQKYVRMRLNRKKFKEHWENVKSRDDAARKIQKFYRNQMKKKPTSPTADTSKPTLSTVITSLPSLSETELDYNEELENEHLKRNILESVRKHKQYENDLEEMDVKIGLLVKNKTTLQEVLSHKKQLKSYKEGGSQTPDALNTNRFSFLSKSGREKLLCYQHLLYLLQIKPIYFTRLLFQTPEVNAGPFVEKTVLPVYDSAKQQREQYLFLRFFRTALEEEIKNKIASVHDVINGECLVLNLVGAYNRIATHDSTLKELLKPLVLRLLKDEKSVAVNTNPQEIYQKWRHDDEHAKHLPETVTNEEALKYPEVKKCLDDSIAFLEEWVMPFVDAITKTANKLPYSIRYISKVLRQKLAEKFPNVPDRDILKAVGSLVYLRYIDPCIASPEKFNIIDDDVAKKLTEDDRKKLGSVAKMLQFAATNMGFGDEHAHLEKMNPFIIKCHTELKQYFAQVCNVSDAEKYYGRDEFTDYTTMTKPTVVISIGELINLRKLLLQHRLALTLNEKNDQLSELLDDFETNEPTISELIGEVDAVTHRRAISTEIFLTLTNKFASRISPEEIEHRALFLKTKKYLIDVLMCQTGTNLVKLLNSITTLDDEEKHRKLVENQCAEKMSLSEKKHVILKNLDTLESYGLVSGKNEYQAIIKSLSDDIRSQKAYRDQRRQERERLEESLRKVQAKTKSYEDQLDSFNKYLQSCVDAQPAHITKKADQVPWKQNKGDSMKNKIVKASATKLKDKKILLSIDDLPNNQLKSVNFEFKCEQGKSLDVFVVTIKWPGNKTENFELVFQDLLLKQFEGVTNATLFNRVKVNVNMLILFLNKKFYSGGSK